MISPNDGLLSGSSCQQRFIRSRKGPGASFSLIFGLKPSFTTR